MLSVSSKLYWSNIETRGEQFLRIKSICTQNRKLNVLFVLSCKEMSHFLLRSAAHNKTNDDDGDDDDDRLLLKDYY